MQKTARLLTSGRDITEKCFFVCICLFIFESVVLLSLMLLGIRFSSDDHWGSVFGLSYISLLGLLGVYSTGITVAAAIGVSYKEAIKDMAFVVCIAGILVIVNIFSLGRMIF